MVISCICCGFFMGDSKKAFLPWLALTTTLSILIMTNFFTSEKQDYSSPTKELLSKSEPKISAGETDQPEAGLGTKRLGERPVSAQASNQELGNNAPETSGSGMDSVGNFLRTEPEAQQNKINPAASEELGDEPVSVYGSSRLLLPQRLQNQLDLFHSANTCTRWDDRALTAEDGEEWVRMLLEISFRALDQHMPEEELLRDVMKVGGSSVLCSSANLPG